MSKFSKNIIGVLCLSLIVLASCDSSSNDDIIFSSDNEHAQISNAALVVHKSIKPEKMSAILNGIWYASKAGNKYKWSFNGNKVSKSLIYSFGEIGTPHVYNMDVIDGFGGQKDDLGTFIRITDEENAEKFMEFQITKHNDNKLILKSKYGSTVILENE